MPFPVYQSPLSDRYASAEMSALFSPEKKYSIWRELWCALAETQRELGLSVSEKQIAQMRAHINSIDFKKAAEYEKKFHHDVMAHIYAYADLCPEARPIIHLGCTSCFVTDNGDLIQIKEALFLLKDKLKDVLKNLCEFSIKNASLPCLAYTHLQPALLTTVGKRVALWVQDLFEDFEQLLKVSAELKFLGAKGANGSQASFLSLFEGDQKKVQQLDQKIAEKMGFEKLQTISGQTYSRKTDVQLVLTLSQLGASTHKLATDLRLLTGFGELQEPFTTSQVGSSAMPFKKNPILSERICSLSRYLISLGENSLYTHATQWLERSLDDSAIRRLTIPEAFLAADGILVLLQRITKALVVNKEQIKWRIAQEMPFLVTEDILMASVKKGADRQAIHERLRQHSIKAQEQMKQGSPHNPLLKWVEEDAEIPLSEEEIKKLTQPSNLTGCSETQTIHFIQKCVLLHLQ